MHKFLPSYAAHVSLYSTSTGMIQKEKKRFPCVTLDGVISETDAVGK